MIVLPGENGSKYVYDSETNEKIFYEPEPVIGMKVKCKVLKTSIAGLDLKITHLDGHETKIDYKTSLRPEFINQDEDSKFLIDEFSVNDEFEGVITEMALSTGIIVSKLK